MSSASVKAPRRVGVWLIGARGSISTCVAYGLAGLRAKLLEPVGLCTEREPFARLPLAPLDTFVVGGHDVCERDLHASGAELVREGILRADLVDRTRAEVGAMSARIRTGAIDAKDRDSAGIEGAALRLGSAPPREQIASITADLAEFRAQERLDALVVVNLASTEAVRPEQREWASLERFDEALDQGRAQPASLLYAYAALASACPYVNFTPSLGASVPALRELAKRKKLPHCGNDGKTGETLVKTVLAPMFTARNLRVLTWQGYNMLGNRDGEVLNDGAHREAKLRNKDEALRSLLQDQNVHTRVGIDFVPSLKDWKTAWDFVHFEGFLGARMTLQFTWSGSDSALAAPLVLDLVRCAEFAARMGESGEMAHTASFFKAPIAGGTHDFRAQFQGLLDYAERHLAAAADPRAARA
ncbi:MAG TPA: inositol-3-phosphate synthase [Planctomycetota bacterium]|jgi:myo-inositol-1-phosphate synthase|nr:inositol-3-phosphate synthase [Planctomycetota bacterium]